MVASGCLPVCIYHGQLLFLFGLESPAETSAKGWSDFVGGMEKHENSENEQNIYEAALREMSEETSGFLGGPNEIDAIIRKNGGFFKYSHEFNGKNNKKGKYHIHLFKLDYDEKLIEYYNNSHKFLYQTISKKLLASTHAFEKIQIQWFTIKDMIQNRHSFRHFYRPIIDQLILRQYEIENFIKTR